MRQKTHHITDFVDGSLEAALAEAAERTIAAELNVRLGAVAAQRAAVES